jgi:hypothetical protein
MESEGSLYCIQESLTPVPNPEPYESNSHPPNSFPKITKLQSKLTTTATVAYWKLNKMLERCFKMHYPRMAINASL